MAVLTSRRARPGGLGRTGRLRVCSGYSCVPVTAKCQDCTGQKVVLLAVTYGELSTMVPLQAFQPPFCTAPLFGVMFSVTVFFTFVDPHLVMSAWVLPAYPDPELVKVIVNGCAAKPGAANSAWVVRVHRFPVQADENVHVSFHF